MRLHPSEIVFQSNFLFMSHDIILKLTSHKYLDKVAPVNKKAFNISSLGAQLLPYSRSTVLRR